MKFKDLLKIADQETDSEKQWTEFIYKKICAFRQESVIEITKKELKKYLGLCIKGSANTEALLSDPLKHKGFLTVAKKGLHEFNTKIPNANNGGKPLFRTIKNKDVQPFVSSRTVMMTKKYGSVENSSISFAQKILSHQFILEEKFICIGVEFKTDSLVRQTLIEMGLPEKIAKEIGQAIQNNMENPNKDAVHRFSKQIFFPCDNDKYVVITPVQHSGLSDEFHRRIGKVVSNSNQFVAFRNTVVAGANPINSGLLNSELGGRHKHLLALPPGKKAPLNILKRILLYLPANKTLFPSVWVEQMDFEVFKKIEKSQSNNRKIRAKKNREIRKIVNFILFDARYLARNLFSIKRPEMVFDFISDVEHKLIDAKYRNGKNISSLEIETLLDTNMSNIRRHHEKILNDSVEKEFREIFKTVFRKGF
ncbi:MAG: hypothetical protein GY710_26575 [Desulfobacteraceae bacterium]|nr:hypothetical protein [Desulfobacteraceae bacterium]